ncbi:MAG: glycerol-3-phosphate dehydrogenase/oxidase [Pirellulaceae bacterium]
MGNQAVTFGSWNRAAAIGRLRERTTPWDLIVIGGGATGVGVALDAASRGLDVLLLEKSDFGKGTSSRSTKLVHGGVRYLRQGNITLVRDALRERTLLRQNAPHLVHDMPFLIPCENRWQRFFYGFGLKVYDRLATRNHFSASYGVSAGEATELVPALRQNRLRGGVIYHDGQFDDTRLLINMGRTAHDRGACLLNYMAVTDLTKGGDGTVAGVAVTDQESGETFQVPSRSVVNATGPFCDAIRKLDDADAAEMLSASQGVHLVLPRRLFPGDVAVIVPKTSDGRILFIIPWHDHVIIGTTDTPITEVSLEPIARAEEIRFLLETAGRYLSQTPTSDDVLSVFTGIRPLVKNDRSHRTASLSRDHVIRVSTSGLITITGGKWTTVRKMAEDCVDRVLVETGIEAQPCSTESIKLHGFTEQPAADAQRSFYGSDLPAIEQLELESPWFAASLHETLSIRRSEVVWAVRHEMARTVEDVLARRTRALFLNARAAMEMAPEVARLMAEELDKDDAWRDEQIANFHAVAAHYLP